MGYWHRPAGRDRGCVRRGPDRGAALAHNLTAGVLLGFLAVHPASAQVFEATGERALGMGGAFVAVADDGTATYWNPAGLALGATVDACVSYGSGEAGIRDAGGGTPGALGSSAASFCFAVPAFGFSYNQLRGSGGGMPISPTAGAAAGRQDLRPREVGVSSLVTRQAGFTLVESILPGVAVGATVKYVRASAGRGVAPAGTGRSDLLDLASQVEGRQTGTFDLDLGVMAAAGPLKAGMTVRNVRAPGFATPDGDELQLPRQVRVGVAVAPGHEALLHASEDTFLVALDVDVTRTPTPIGDRRMVAAGVEQWLRGHRLGLRAGVRANTLGAARPAATAGISLGVRAGVFLEGHAARGGRDADRGWGLGLRVGF